MISMPKRTKSYDNWQMAKLANPAAAASFLNAALADSQEMFLLALRKVAQAREMAKVAKEAGVQRETLYHALSEEGNPTLATLSSVLSAVGMELLIAQKSVQSFRSAETALPTTTMIATHPGCYFEDSRHRDKMTLPSVVSVSYFRTGPIHQSIVATQRPQLGSTQPEMQKWSEQQSHAAA